MRHTEALEWYKDQVTALQRYMSSETPNTDAIEAIMTALSLDGGNRAEIALSHMITFEFTSDDDALEVLKSYGHEEYKNGMIKADWNTFDERCRAAINYLCNEWDFAFEHIDAPPEPDQYVSLAMSTAEPVSVTVKPLDDWHEDDGFAVWWTWQDGDWLGEPSYIGSPLCSDWPGYHTHWTPHPKFQILPEQLARSC
jgi:hypothetical protein